MGEKTGKTLKVLNPQGEIDTSMVKGVTPCVADLSGKTIGLYWNGKPDGDLFWDIIESNLKKKFPQVKVLRYNGPGDLGEMMAPKIAQVHGQKLDRKLCLWKLRYV